MLQRIKVDGSPYGVATSDFERSTIRVACTVVPGWTSAVARSSRYLDLGVTCAWHPVRRCSTSSLRTGQGRTAIDAGAGCPLSYSQS